MKKAIAEDLGLEIYVIDNTLKNAHIHVKHHKIDKRNGGKRNILLPSAQLKIIQYWLMHVIFQNMEIHHCATAFRKSTSTKLNAQRHKDNLYFLKIDLNDFFPSISYVDLVPLVMTWHGLNSPKWLFNHEANYILQNSCFDKNGRLPIGYPSSPIISNIVMIEFDNKVTEVLESNASKLGNVIYSRYADDMVFSTQQEGACKEIYKFVSDLINTSVSPRISINTQKVFFGTRRGGSTLVTGLRICEDGHLTVHRKYKDRIRLLISRHKKGLLGDIEVKSLKGHLNYISHVDPRFFNKLQTKYFPIFT